MKIFFIALLSFSIFSCNSQEKVETDDKVDHVFLINPGVEFSQENTADFKQIIVSLEEFLRTKNNDYAKNDYWVQDDHEYFLYPFYEIFEIEKNKFDEDSPYKPTLLSLTKINDDTVKVKMGWFTTVDDFSAVKVIYNFLAVRKDKTFIFKNILDYNTSNWQAKKVGNIDYYYYPEFNFDSQKGVEFDAFNNHIASFFAVEPLKIDYFLSKNTHHLMSIRGYDFHPSMFFQDQISAETFSHDNLIFSGNNSEIYRHELLHLYTYWNFPDHHRIIDEGIATYFGGSKGLTYEDHLAKVKKHVENNKVDIYQELFFSDYILDEATSLMYTVGALLCELALQKHGKEGLYKLLNSGNSTEELIVTVEKLFDLKNKEEFNAFIFEELENSGQSLVNH